MHRTYTRSMMFVGLDHTLRRKSVRVSSVIPASGHDEKWLVASLQAAQAPAAGGQFPQAFRLKAQ